MLSIPHLIVIFVVALVIFGPEKLPELAKNLGKLMAEFRRTTTDLRGTFESHLRDLEREANNHRIDTPRSPANDSAAANSAPEIVAAPGTVPADAPHTAAVAAGTSASDSRPSATTPDTPTTYPDDPEELIRQAEAQIARERASENETEIERVSDGGIGKP